MECVAGVDLGAGTAKAVIVDRAGAVIGDAVRPTRADFLAVGRASLTAACEMGGIRMEDIAYIAATGFGRYNFDYRSIQITDLTCAARGGFALYPDARFVLDMGAQSTRAIALRDGGKVAVFRTNEKCAAGSGGFLERVARYLEVPLDQLGDISLQATDPQPISSVCAVLAESEIINHVSEGRSVADIVCGAHLSLADRALGQLKRVGFDGPVVFIGGVARQRGMVQACRDKFGQPVLVPENPSHVVAFGAALLGLQRLTRRATQESVTGCATSHPAPSL